MFFQTTGNRTAEIKCSQCLQSGHKFSQCVNNWVCRKCNNPGHKELDCVVQDEDDSEDKESDSEEEQASSTAVSQSTKPAHSAEIKHKASLNTPRPKRQPSMDRYINMTPSNSNVKDTPVQPKRGNPPERSPPTPVEVLQEKTSKKSKSQRKK